MSDTFNLTGKKILVTGASSGIGRETAIQASRHGATLFITGRDKARLDDTFARLTPPDPIHTPHALFTCDLTDQLQLESLTGSIPELDGIVHGAGIVGPLPVKFITPEEIDRMFAINFRVPVLLTSMLLRSRKVAKGASVVFMSTIATRNPYFGGAMYSSAKAALEAYSKTLALEMVSRQIRSNCIQAGLVDTPMIENPSEPGMQEEALKRYLNRYPLGIGSPGDVTGAILWFLSDLSRWVTGTSLIMGGE